MLATNPGDVVLDPMVGVGSSVVAALRTGRRFIAYDLNADYLDLAAARLRRTEVDSLRLDRTTNGSAALRELLAWAFGRRREFSPTDDRVGTGALGRLGPGYLAVRADVMSRMLAKWGYDETVVRRQWADEGLLMRSPGKLTRVVRLGRRTARCVVLRLQ